MTTWLVVPSVPVVQFAAFTGILACLLHRTGFSLAGVVAYRRMRRRPAMSSDETAR